MTDTRRLNKALWVNITRLKLLAKPDAPVRFILEKSPFNEDDDEQDTVKEDDYVITGRILSNSDIYKGAYRIEIKLTSRYPIEPPEVRFLTRIYHPNVDLHGKFCHHLLNNHSRWTLNREITLVDILIAVVTHLDEPDPDYAVTFDAGKEFVQNRAEFNRKALESVRKHALPRK